MIRNFYSIKISILYVLTLTYSGNLPHLSYILRKPEPLGTEFKNVCCSKTGVLLFLEVQKGKDVMANAEFTNQMSKMSALTTRMMKYSKPHELIDI